MMPLAGSLLETFCSALHNHDRVCNMLLAATGSPLWSFDLKGIGEMYRSYEARSFWPFLSAPTQGIHIQLCPRSAQQLQLDPGRPRPPGSLWPWRAHAGGSRLAAFHLTCHHARC